HPVGCAMALAQIREIETKDLNAQSARMGKLLLDELRGLKTEGSLQTEIRGLGLLAGLELRFTDGKPAKEMCLALTRYMLRAGFILLPEGASSNVVSFTPPLVISKDQISRTISTLQPFLAGRLAGPRRRPPTR